MKRFGKSLLGLLIGFAVWVGSAQLGMFLHPAVAVPFAVIGMMIGVQIWMHMTFPPSGSRLVAKTKTPEQIRSPVHGEVRCQKCRLGKSEDEVYRLTPTQDVIICHDCFFNCRNLGELGLKAKR